MFTGIIEEIGEIKDISNSGDGVEITIKATSNFLKNVKLGDSIAINGACQTVTRLSNNNFHFFTSKQTLELTNLSDLRSKKLVNLEKALTLSKGLDGHLVSGHVDGTGIIKNITKQKTGYLISITIPLHVIDTVVKKGSICIDGISLTIYDLKDNVITVSAIPFTYDHTTLKFKKNSDKVNIETDLIGKYIVNYFNKNNDATKNSISINFLKENGFI